MIVQGLRSSRDIHAYTMFGLPGCNSTSSLFDQGLRADPRETPAVERLGRGSKLKSLPTNSSPADGGCGCAIESIESRGNLQNLRPQRQELLLQHGVSRSLA